MTQRSLAVLVILNAVLLSAIAMTFGANPQSAQAQLGGGGQYLILAGSTQQREAQEVIYVMQVNTGQVAAVLVNSGNKRVDRLAPRDVSRDLRGESGGGGGDNGR